MKKPRLSLFLLLLLGSVLTLKGAPETVNPVADLPILATVEITNPSPFERPDALAEVEVSELAIPDDLVEKDAIAVYGGEHVIPTQWVDQNGDGAIDLLILQLDLSAGERVLVDLVDDPAAARANASPKRTQVELSRRVGGHWEDGIYEGGGFQPIREISVPGQLKDHNYFFRYEGPGWESDRVGYRLYFDHRNAIDVFGKRDSSMVLQKVGLDGYQSYHEDAPWGLDILKVGSALGLGGFGVWDGESAHNVSKTSRSTCRILHNGHVQSRFQLIYEDWESTAGRTDLTATLSIHGGSELTSVSLNSPDAPAALVTGIPRHGDVTVFHGPTEIPGNTWTWLASYGPQSIDGKNLGMVVFVKENYLKSFEQDEANELVVLQSRGGEARYRFGAYWEDGSEHAADLESFKEHVAHVAETLNRPLRTHVETGVKKLTLQRYPAVENSRYWTRQLAESIRQRRGNSLAYGSLDPESLNPAKWSYTTGLISMAMDEVGRVLDLPHLQRFAEKTVGSYITEEGDILTYDIEDYNIDKINSGKMLLRLYERTDEERFRKASEHLLRQLEEHPRTSGGAFWHKKIYPHQVWLDGVYMAAPFMAHAGKLFDRPEYFEELGTEFSIVQENLYDKKTELYHHGWDESGEQSWADNETGLSSTFWGRGLGWFSMALVDSLDYLPENSAEAKELRKILNLVASGVARWQDEESGLWYQVLHRGGDIGNYLEASASSMFVYTLAKGVNEGYLDKKYAEVAKRGYKGMVDHFISIDAEGELSVQHICQVAGLGYGRPGDYDYYMEEPEVKNDGKGIGPFLLAGLQISNLDRK